MAQELKAGGEPPPITREAREALERQGCSPEEIVGLWKDAIQLWRGDEKAFFDAFEDEGPQEGTAIGGVWTRR